MNRFLRPEFVYRPRQLFRAIRQKFAGDPSGKVVCELPWRYPVSVNPKSDFVGHRVYRHGLMAIEACETAFRLLDVGDHAIDIGANQGIVTSAMLARVAARNASSLHGSVTSIEMMPSTFDQLSKNVFNWPDSSRSILVTHNLALSDTEGTISVGLSQDFQSNTGVAYCTHEKVPDDHQNLSVPCTTLDRLIGIPDHDIQLMKIDVERHEYSVLLGAREILHSQKIKNILIEDDFDANSPAKAFLRSHGYEIFRLKACLRGIKLEPLLVENLSEQDPDTYIDYLATLDAFKAKKAFRSLGYKCLMTSR